MTSLYKISENYISVLNILNDNDDIEDKYIEDTLELIESDFKDKALNIASMIKNMQMMSENAGKYIESVSDRKRNIDSKIDKLISYLKSSMIKVGVDSVENSELKVSKRKCPKKVNIYNNEIIPPSYIKHIVKESVDKSLIKQSIESGKCVPGASLEQNYSLIIK